MDQSHLEIETYIRQAIAHGMSELQITATLQKNGWNNEQIRNGLVAAGVTESSEIGVPLGGMTARSVKTSQDQNFELRAVPFIEEQTPEIKKIDLLPLRRYAAKNRGILKVLLVVVPIAIFLIAGGLVVWNFLSHGKDVSIGVPVTATSTATTTQTTSFVEL